MSRLLLVALVLFCSIAFANDEVYKGEIESWRQQRMASLKEKWLSLVGLDWLKPGKNTFGADPQNDLQLASENAPAQLGTFFLQEGQVRFRAAANVEVRHNDKPVEEIAMRPDDSGEATLLTHGSLRWYIIRRGYRLGVRTRDSKNPLIAQVTHLDIYPVDRKWRVEATFQPYDPPKQLTIANILGTSENEECPGLLLFSIAGKKYSLAPVVRGDQFFLMIADTTTGEQTYPGGRYMYVAKPDAAGKVIIDFNKAYNPPCAYSRYVTCPLPPKENHLPLAVTAGEKNVHGKH